MIFHILKDPESYREEMLQRTDSATADWIATVKKMRDNIIICNYKFLRDMSKILKMIVGLSLDLIIGYQMNIFSNHKHFHSLCKIENDL